MSSTYDKNDIRQAFQVLERRAAPKPKKSSEVGPGSYEIKSTLFNKQQVVPVLYSKTRRYIDKITHDSESVAPNTYHPNANHNRQDKLYMKQFGLNAEPRPGCQTYNINHKSTQRKQPSWRMYTTDKAQQLKVTYDEFRGPGCHMNWENGFKFITK